MFRKKKPKRLYYPVKSRWYTRPRRKPSVKRTNKLFKGGWSGVKIMLKKSLYLTVTTGIFIALILFLAFSSYFSVTDIEVVRENFNIDSAEIENEVNQYIGKSIIFFPKTQIHKTIQTKFPEFASIEIRKILPSTIKIHLESHEIVANLRAYYVLPEAEKVTKEDFTELNKAIEELSGSDPEIESLEELTPLGDEEVADAIFDLGEEDEGPAPIEQKSLINRIGQAIFDQQENLELITIIVHDLSQPVEDREQIITREHMDYMLEAIQYLKNTMDLEILEIKYLPIAREIHLKTNNNLVLWLGIGRDYKEQIDKLNTIYENAELNKEDLAYIDLRIKDKVIYCSRDTQCDN
jgi:cell division septal protein FtsQ